VFLRVSLFPVFFFSVICNITEHGVGVDVGMLVLVLGCCGVVVMVCWCAGVVLCCGVGMLVLLVLLVVLVVLLVG
jgi:hypothetical protein